MGTVALQSSLGGPSTWLTTSHAVPKYPSASPTYDFPSASSTLANDATVPTVASPAWSNTYQTPVKESPVSSVSIGTDVTDGDDSEARIEESDMKQVKTKATIGILATLISYVSVNSYVKTTNPEAFVWVPEDREEAEWAATSRWWLDRKACRWLGLCGLQHISFARTPSGKTAHEPEGPQDDLRANVDWQHHWKDTEFRPEEMDDDERRRHEIPDYVMEYAPLVHLFSGEEFWPCDIADHLHHVTPNLNYTPIYPETRHASLTNLNKFNKYNNGRWVFLTSNDDVEDRPKWLSGQQNIPADPSDDDAVEGMDLTHYPGRTYAQGIKEGMQNLKDWFAPSVADIDQHEDFKKSLKSKPVGKQNGSFRDRYHQELRRSPSEPAKKQLRGGRSDAPATLVVIDKGHGIVDAFWFFFYSFNLGNVVFNIRFGNHVGDWEHSMVRFHHGKPKGVYFSKHDFGGAYTYEAVEKIGKRPVVYSAVGTHAMYPTPGVHPYVLPWGILHDETDRGPLWDPSLNTYSYTYETQNQTLRASNLTPKAPLEWFHYNGRWGDKFYPLGDKRQYRFAGQYHYVNGPTGPKSKHLDRSKICEGPTSNPCVIKNWIGGVDEIRLSPGFDRDEKPEDDL